MASIKLTVWLDGAPVQSRELAPGQYVVGSSLECDLVLDHPQVSPRAILLEVSPFGVACRDLAPGQAPALSGPPLAVGPFALTWGDPPPGQDLPPETTQHPTSPTGASSTEGHTRVIPAAPAAEDPEVVARLVVRGGSQDGQTFPLRPGRFCLGRSPENQIHLTHPSVSRQHAEIEVDAEGILVRDLGSTAGLLLDGRRVNQARLEPGGSLRLGEVELHLEGSRREPSPINPSPGPSEALATPAFPPLKPVVSRKRLFLYGGAGLALLLLALALIFGGSDGGDSGQLDRTVQERQRGEEASQRQRLVVINLAKARQALEAGSHDQAINHLRQALAADPEQAEAKALLAQAQSAKEQADALASRQRQEAAQRQAQIDQLLSQAQAALAQARTGPAEDLARQALDLDPDQALARHLVFQARALAEQTLRQQETEAATRQLRETEAAKLVANAEAALKADRLAPAREGLVQALALDPSRELPVTPRANELLALVETRALKQAENLVQQGGAQMKKGNLLEAQAAFLRALGLKPDLAAAQEGLAKARLGLQRQAQRLIQEGDVLEGLGKRSQACAKWSQALPLLTTDDPLRQEVKEKHSVCSR